MVPLKLYGTLYSPAVFIKHPVSPPSVSVSIRWGQGACFLGFMTSECLTHHTHPLVTIKYFTCIIYIEALRKPLPSQTQSPI